MGHDRRVALGRARCVVFHHGGTRHIGDPVNRGGHRRVTPSRRSMISRNSRSPTGCAPARMAACRRDSVTCHSRDGFPPIGLPGWNHARRRPMRCAKACN